MDVEKKKTVVSCMFLGLVFGIVFDNMALGAGIGVAVGVARARRAAANEQATETLLPVETEESQQDEDDVA